MTNICSNCRRSQKNGLGTGEGVGKRKKLLTTMFSRKWPQFCQELVCPIPHWRITTESGCQTSRKMESGSFGSRFMYSATQGLLRTLLCTTDRGRLRRSPQTLSVNPCLTGMWQTRLLHHWDLQAVDHRLALELCCTWRALWIRPLPLLSFSLLVLTPDHPTQPFDVS